MLLLPPPPRATSAGRLAKRLAAGVFIALLALGMLGGMGFYAFTIADGLMADRTLFAGGIPAADGHTDGTSRTRRMIFHEYKLELRYTDRDGARHVARQQFDTLLGEVDQHAYSEIRYDPAHPDRAVSSWSLDVTVSRAAWAVTAAAMSLLGAFLAYAAARAFRDAFLEREAARDGQEVRARLGELSRDQHGNVTYSLAVCLPSGEIVTDKTTLHKRSPWRLDEANVEALALYDERRRRLFVVESDGLPVALTEAELAEARELDGSDS